MKKFTNREIATIKRTAQNVYPIVAKRTRINAQIEELTNELKTLEIEQASWEAAIKTMTGGYTTDELVIRVVTPYFDENGNQKMDKNGNPMKTTKFSLRYPETVIPMDMPNGTESEVYQEKEVEEAEGVAESESMEEVNE